MIRKIFFFTISALIVLILPWIYISMTTYQRVYEDIDTVPKYEFGLLLGTSPGPTNSNLFFRTRIEAAKELYERGKIRRILVSGDNSTREYNEPELMRLALVKAGVAEKDITLDYAGFRTLDSVLRAKEVFSLTGGFTIISQPFHVERALFLADANDIPAIGYGAKDVSPKYGLFAYIREIGARWLALYDAWTGKSATVLGAKEKIES
jgi:SanA protein